MDDIGHDDDVTEQAISWFLRLHAGMSDEDWEAHLRWLEADASHIAAFAEVEQTWIDADGISALEREQQGDSSAVVAFQPRSRLPTRRQAVWFSGAIAAGIAALTVLPWKGGGEGVVETYRSGPSSGRVVMLADGSRLSLNRATEIAVRLGSDARAADLKTGEAVFDVYHDATRPFTVTAGAHEIRVLGTEFDVLSAGGRFSVAVRRGLVAVVPSNGGSGVKRLPAGSILVRDADASAYIVSTGDADDAFAWTEGRLTYTDQPITRLAADLERYGGTPVTVDPALLQMRVTATIEIGDGTKLGRQIEMLLPVRLQRKGPAIVIAPAR